jgi:putative membrane protein
MMWRWPMMGFGGFGMIFGFIFFVAIVIGIILLVIWLVKRPGFNTTDKTSTKSMEVLKERYAKGELTKEQYENMKKDLLS